MILEIDRVIAMRRSPPFVIEIMASVEYRKAILTIDVPERIDQSVDKNARV
ncbi:hypothetical protein D9M68_502670 [compost metagenome]